MLWGDRALSISTKILFGVAVAILIASLAGAVWSAAVPDRRIWPPPGRRSWQYFLTWAGVGAWCDQARLVKGE